MLVLQHVSKQFSLGDGRTLPVLHSISFEVSAGESIALMGPSGSGKSTLLNLIGLLDSPTSGLVLLDDMDTSRLREPARARLRGEKIGFVFQQFHLIDHRTAVENVAEPFLFGRTRRLLARHSSAIDLLQQVGLGHRLGSMPHQLSGGEQQRVAIARALVNQPTLICADEPTGALDESNGDSVLDLLIGLVRAQGTSLVLATHDQRVARRTDRIIEIRGGELTS